MQSIDRRIGRHFGRFLRSGHSQPDRCSKSGRSCAKDVAGEAVADHRRGNRLDPQPFADFNERSRIRLSLPELPRDHHLIESPGKAKIVDFFPLHRTRTVCQQPDPISAAEPLQCLNGIRHQPLQTSPDVAKRRRQDLAIGRLRRPCRAKHTVEVFLPYLFAPCPECLEALVSGTVQIPVKGLLEADADPLAVRSTGRRGPCHRPVPRVRIEDIPHGQLMPPGRFVHDAFERLAGNRLVHHKGVIQVKNNGIDRHGVF